MKTLQFGEVDVIAVSWRRKGIALFVLDPTGNSKEVQFSKVELPEKLSRDTRGHSDDHSAYSRDLLLLKSPGAGKGFLLLTAIRPDRRSTWEQEVECWSCELEKKGTTWKLKSARSSKLNEPKEDSGGSVYRFLDVSRDDGDSGEARHVMIGLAGRDGRAEIAQLKIEITPKGTILTSEGTTSFGLSTDKSPAESPGKTTQRNRIWSLAKTKHGVVAGSDNGEIWYIPLESPEEHTRVGQLASAVTALEAGEVGGKIRVYAGARDGTLIAFQEAELPASTLPKKRSFATLWATVERSAISYIDRHQYRDPEESFDLVIAVSRKGMCLAFDDRMEMEPFKAEVDAVPAHPQRPAFPGIRWLRTSTARTCFAALSLPNRLRTEGAAWRLLAMASGDGKLDLLSLHYPRYTAGRKKEFKQHFDDLWAVACENAEKGAPENLRAVEATYRSAPLIPLIIVRLLLDPSREDQNVERLRQLSDLDRWWFPKFLRPLLDLRAAWDLASAAALQPDVRKRASEDVARALGALLDTAWRRKDVDLFQEISALVLKRTNFMLFGLDARFSAEVEAMKDLYFAVFDAIESSLQNWLGAELDKENSRPNRRRQESRRRRRGASSVRSPSDAETQSKSMAGLWRSGSRVSGNWCGKAIRS